MQTDLFTLDFTGVAGHEASSAQRGLERCVVVDQGTCDAVTGRTGLAGFTTTVHIDLNIEGFEIVGQCQGLLGNHDGGLAAKVSLDVLAIHGDLAGAFFQKHTGDARFATAGAIVPFTNHLSAP